MRGSQTTRQPHVQWDIGDTGVSGGVFGVLGWLFSSSLWLSDRDAGPEFLGLIYQEKPQREFLGSILIIKLGW